MTEKLLAQLVSCFLARGKRDSIERCVRRRERGVDLRGRLGQMEGDPKMWSGGDSDECSCERRWWSPLRF